jgi:RNA polymerase sigma-70 factor (ECF subfamily)
LELQQLIHLTARGDKTAFATLYAQSAAKLFGIAMRIVGQQQDAEEVLQEAFITVWRRAGEYEPGRGSAMPWLTTIVRHCAIDHRRRRAVRPDRGGAPEALLLSFADPARTERGAELNALRRCLGELEEQPRKAVLLAYIWGLTREEIAAACAVPLGTVKSWIRRSLERLKRCLDG